MIDSGSTYCKNCGAVTKDLFCAHCGQRTSVDKITFRETLNDLTNNLLSLRSPLFLTFKTLISNPGIMLREYLDGKRKKYYKPIPFFILCTLLYLFVRWIIDFDEYSEIPIGRNGNQMDLELFSRARDYMFQNIKSMAFILVFTLAAFTKLLFAKKYTLAEYLAVSFYLNGFYSLFATLNLFYIKYFDAKIQWLAVVVMSIYFIYVMTSFLHSKPFKVGLKSFLVFWLAYAGYLFLTISISYLIVMFGQT